VGSGASRDSPPVLHLGVLVSGSGTIFEAMVAAGLPVRLVIADRACRALDIAAASCIPAQLVDRSRFGGFGAEFDRPAYTAAVTEALVAAGVDVVAMAGFGALLPAFPGWHAVADALAAGVAETGTTVHVATLEMDAGPVLARAPVPVLPNDTEETLHERIKEVERRLYPQTIRHFIDELAAKAGDETGAPSEVSP
jgi:phosphoribosylglycinamide formyltransferase-1